MLVAASILALAQTPEAVQILPAERLNERLAQLAAAHGELATAFDLGTTRGGRTLRGLALAAPELPANAPAVLLVGGLEGPRTYESGVVLHHAERLCAGRPDVLERVRVYVVPRVAVDAAEHRWSTPRAEVFATGSDADSDRDGLSGEDPVADVDGDGVIAWMRVPDDEGELLPDPHDERANTVADPKLGQRGRFRVVREGYDSDGDERASEDGPADGRVDRSFPARWNEHAPEAGRFPLEDPAARALADFVIEHPELVMAVCYGDADNLAEEPKAAQESNGRVPSPGWMESDAEWLAALGESWREDRPEDALPKPSLHDPEPGSFVAWAYEHRGLWVVAARLWDLPGEEPPEEEAEEPEEAEEAAESDDDSADEQVAEGDEATEGEEPEGPPGEPSDEAGELAWIDATGESWRFLPWTPFEHPDLGPVEIGGFAPFARFDPPEAEHAAIADERYAFFLELVGWLPRLALDEPELEELGPGLWELRATLRNEGRLPVASAAGQRMRYRPRIVLELTLPDGASLVAGDARQPIESLDGEGGSTESTWWIASDDPSGLRLDVTSPHFGSITREVTR